MKKVLILGSSHVGALRRADAAFRDRFPGIETDYFAVKAPMLRRGRAEGAVFRPFVHNEDEHELLQTLNGRAEADLSQYDKTLVVGFRSHPLDINALFETHAMLGSGDDERPFRASLGFVTDWLERIAADWAGDINARFGNAPGCVFTVAPFPAGSLRERADENEMAARFRTFRDNPHAETLFDIWATALERAIAGQGFGYLPQPPETLDGPYATRSEYALGGTAADGEPMEQGDHRHMNAGFGLLMLEQFAIRHLDQLPRPC
ncbi:MAG: hypothetical protein ACK5MY_17080 [Jhaorihella sp.]